MKGFSSRVFISPRPSLRASGLCTKSAVQDQSPSFTDVETTHRPVSTCATPTRSSYSARQTFLPPPVAGVECMPNGRDDVFYANDAICNPPPPERVRVHRKGCRNAASALTWESDANRPALAHSTAWENDINAPPWPPASPSCEKIRPREFNNTQIFGVDPRVCRCAGRTCFVGRVVLRRRHDGMSWRRDMFPMSERRRRNAATGSFVHNARQQ
jgi:hypothetical protein